MRLGLRLFADDLSMTWGVEVDHPLRLARMVLVIRTFRKAKFITGGAFGMAKVQLLVQVQVQHQKTELNPGHPIRKGLDLLTVGSSELD